MYSNNDFRNYKVGSYLAHYGKKGMKWHKHLKATTNWWDEHVSGKSARDDMLRAQRGYHQWSTGDSFHPEIRTNPKGKKVYRNSNRFTAAGFLRSEYNRENLEAKKRYDKSLRGKAENTANIIGRNIEKTARRGTRAIGSAAKNAVNFVDDKTFDARYEVGYQAKRAKNKVTQAVAGSDSKKRMAKASDDIKKYSHDTGLNIYENLFRKDFRDRALKDYDRAKSEYNSSLRGRAESAARKVKNKVKNRQYKKKQRQARKKYRSDRIQVKPITVKPITVR